MTDKRRWLLVLGLLAIGFLTIIPWKKPVTVQLPNLGPLPEPTASPNRVVDYTMHVGIDSSHRVIEGTSIIHWTNPSTTPADGLWWHLYMNAFEGPRSLFMQTGGAVHHRGNTPGQHRGSIRITSMQLASGEDLLLRRQNDPRYPDDQTQLYTPLSRPVGPNETIEIRMAFRTVLPDAFARSGNWQTFAFAGQWFPKLCVRERDGTWAHFPYHAHSEFYADFGKYDVSITAPTRDILAASGDRIESPRVLPHGRLLHHYVADRVHDFAFTAWEGFVQTEQTLQGVRVKVVSPAGLGTVVTRALNAVNNGLLYYGALYGQYPYNTLTVVIPPEQANGVAGMEYPTLITIDGSWWLPSSFHDVEYVTLHELGHQYFYGLVATNEWAWPFLDEGLTEFSTGLVMTAMYGQGNEMVDYLGFRVGFSDYQSAGSAWIDPPHPVAQSADRFPDYFSYGNHVYRRTASVFDTLQRNFGSQAILRGLARYAREQRFRHPTPPDLITAIAAEAGPQAGEFLNTSIRNAGNVDYSIRVARSYSQPHPHGSIATDVTVSRSHERNIVLTITASTSHGERITQPWNPPIGVLQELITLHTHHPVTDVSIDPEHRFPLDTNVTNNTVLNGSSHSRWATSLGFSARLCLIIAILLRALGVKPTVLDKPSHTPNATVSRSLLIILATELLISMMVSLLSVNNLSGPLTSHPQGTMALFSDQGRMFSDFVRMSLPSMPKFGRVIFRGVVIFGVVSFIVSLVLRLRWLNHRSVKGITSALGKLTLMTLFAFIGYAIGAVVLYFVVRWGIHRSQTIATPVWVTAVRIGSAIPGLAILWLVRNAHIVMREALLTSGFQLRTALRLCWQVLKKQWKTLVLSKFFSDILTVSVVGIAFAQLFRFWSPSVISVVAIVAVIATLQLGLLYAQKQYFAKIQLTLADTLKSLN